MNRIFTTLLAFLFAFNYCSAQSGNAINLNGTTDYVSIGNMGAMPNQGTITLWMQADALPSNWRNVLTTGDLTGCSNGNNAIRFEKYGSTFGVAVAGAGTGCSVNGGNFTTSLQVGVPYHVAITWNKTTNILKGYFNGSLAFNVSNTSWPTNFQDVKIGVGFDATRLWDGKVDEVTFWDKELTAGDVYDVRLKNFNTADPNLYAYYTFDGNTTNGASQTVVNVRNPGTYNGATVGSATTPTFTSSFVPSFAGTGVKYADVLFGFSSQYGNGSWSAAQILGTPNAWPGCGDISTAWASSSPDGQREWLELGFQNLNPVNNIKIYETNAAGAIDTVYVWNPNTQAWVQVYSATAASVPCRILNINFTTTSFNVSRIRIAVNSPAVSSWNELDAVSISNIANGGTIGSNQTICNQTPSQLTNIDSAFVGDPTVVYQWQDSTASGTWQNISGATSATYQPPTLTQTTYYRRKATLGAAVDYSNTVTLTLILNNTAAPPGVNQWIFYGYSGYSLDLTGVTLYGSYSRNTVSFQTDTSWCSSCSPANATGWAGCALGADNFTLVAKRVGFPAGPYTLQVPFHDDGLRTYKNGVQIFQTNGCCGTSTVFNIGYLGANDSLEIRVAEGGGGAGMTVLLNIQQLTPGTIAGNATICSGDTHPMTSTASATGGSGNYSYQWQDSVVSGTWTNISGANSAAYTSAPLTQNTWFRRKVTDDSLTVAYSNVVQVSIATVAGDTTIYGVNSWNYYAFNNWNGNGNYSLANLSYRGYYTNSSLNIATGNDWSMYGNPSQATTYQGCPVNDDFFTVLAKRKGFPGGPYIINLVNHDDDIYIFKNNVLFYSASCCNTSGIISMGALGANDSIRIILGEQNNPAYMTLNFQVQTLSSGTIAGTENLCGTQVPSQITSTQGAYGGNTAVFNYQWQDSVANGTWQNISGATSAAYTPSVLTQTTWYRRRVNDGIDSAFTNAIAKVHYSIQGNPADTGNNVWNAYVYNGADPYTLSNNSYRGYYVDSNQNIINTNFYSGYDPASNAPGYLGCLSNADYQTVVYKRRGFRAGNYSINVGHDDVLLVYKNGNLVYNVGCCPSSNVINIGYLNADTVLEFRVTDYGGYGYLTATFNRLDSFIHDYASSSCNQYTLSNINSSNWWDFTDATGKVIASINANGNNLGNVSLKIRHNGTGTANIPMTTGSNIPYMPRYFDWQSSNYPTGNFPTPVAIRLYYKTTEFDDYKLVSNQSSLAFSGLKIFHYDGANEDCDINNNTVPSVEKPTTNGTFTTTGFYVQASIPSFSETGVVGDTPKPNLGNDTAVNVCPAFTIDITTLKNTAGLFVNYDGTSTPTAVGPGTYTLRVADHFAKMDTAVISVGLHPKPNLGNDTTVNVCPGFTTDITTLKNTTGLTTQWFGTSTPTAVAQGTYTLIVTNQFGCMDTTVITVNLHPKPNIGSDMIVNICPGFPTNLNTLYNTSGLTVQWLGTSTPTSVNQGTYTLIVTNPQGCMDTAVVNVILNQKPNLGSDISTNVCPGFTTDLTTMYSTTGLTTQYNGTSTPTAVGPGVYTLIVTNSQGCKDTAQITVGLHPKPNLGNDTTVNICPGFPTDITTLKNTTGLTTQWLGTSTPTSVGAGTYTLIVTNAQGCKDTALISVGLHAKPNLGNDTTVSICPGFPTDITTLKNTTGLTTQWTGTSTPTSVSAGTYTLVVTNATGCKDTAIVTVTNYPKPNIGNDTTVNVCPGFSTDITTLKNTTGLTTQYVGTSTPTTVGAGTYTLIVTNGTGCKDTAVITVGLNPKPNVGNDTTVNVCPGFTTNITTLKNTTGLTTQWLGTSTPTTVGAGTYTLIVTNGTGCKDTAVITVGLNAKPNIGNDTTVNVCPGFTTDITALKNTSGLTTSWSGTSTPTAVGAGMYTLIVTNGTGCKDTAIITVGNYTKPNIGNDTTVNICQAATTNLTALKNTTGLTTQWVGTSTPTSAGAGTYTLIVTNTTGCKDTAVITVGNHPTPNSGADTTFYAWIGESINLKNVRDTAGFAAMGWTHSWWSSQNGTSGNTTVVVPDTGMVTATLIATSQYGCVGDTTNITIIAQDNIVPPVGPTNVTANVEVTHPTNGWTNYYFNSNTPTNKADDILLLSLKKNGNAIGTIGSGAFNVQNNETSGAGSNTGIQITNPLMSNPSGYYTMRRYWQVTANSQPTTNVGVRFYYNTQDYNDANGSVGGTKTMQQLVFYHLKNGNPDPASNWAGATIQAVSIMNGSVANDTTWIYTNLGENHHRAEFTVNSFSGGSGGFTGNNGPLPIELLSFTAKANKDDAVLNWQTGAGKDISSFEIERSADGTSFNTINEVGANSAGTSSLYHYVDKDAQRVGENLYYRLKMKYTSGQLAYSNIEQVKFSNMVEQIVMIPNPAKEKITILGAADFQQVRVVDILGKLVLQQAITGNSQEVNISRLAAGAYTVQLVNGSRIESLKLIKE
jgi:hypothetical protein